LFTRFPEDGIVGTRSELIHFHDFVSLVCDHLLHGGPGVVVPVSTFCFMQVIIIMTVSILDEAMAPGYQHPLDVVQILLYVLLCEENECVPTEYQIATALWYV